MSGGGAGSSNNGSPGYPVTRVKCPWCDEYGREKVQGHPDHTIYCDQCRNGYREVPGPLLARVEALIERHISRGARDRPSMVAEIAFLIMDAKEGKVTYYA